MKRLREWWWRMRHYCKPPLILTANLGQRWSCPECKQKWEVQEGHDEDLVAVGNDAMADIGQDWIEWVRVS